MSANAHDRRRLHTLRTRLRQLELHLPQPHMRGIHAVALEAVCDEIHSLTRRLNEGSYWRPSAQAARAHRSSA